MLGCNGKIIPSTVVLINSSEHFGTTFGTAHGSLKIVTSLKYVTKMLKTFVGETHGPHTSIAKQHRDPLTQLITIFVAQLGE